MLFYNWQRQLFEDGSIVFERKAKTANKKRQDDARSVKIEQLEAKLQNKNNKNEVLAELLEEHLKLKKAVGGP